MKTPFSADKKLKIINHNHSCYIKEKLDKDGKRNQSNKEYFKSTCVVYQQMLINRNVIYGTTRSQQNDDKKERRG